MAQAVTQANIQVRSMKKRPILTARYAVNGEVVTRKNLTRYTRTVGLAEKYAITYEEPLNDPNAEDVPVVIQDCWIVLAGYKTDIEERMVNECPLTLYHIDDIYDVLDHVPHDQVIIAFSAFAPDNKVLYNSYSYRYMRATQKTIIADLYNVSPSSVIMLPDVFWE